MVIILKDTNPVSYQDYTVHAAKISGSSTCQVCNVNGHHVFGVLGLFLGTATTSMPASNKEIASYIFGVLWEW